MRPELETLVPATGRALDIACGRGAQTTWLAQRGLHVIALDVSDEAVKITKQAAEDVGVANRVSAKRIDLSDGLSTDLGSFHMVLCQRFSNRAVLDSLVARLVPGGTAFVSVLSVVGLQRSPGRFHAAAGALTDIFSVSEVEIVWHHEGDGLAAIAIRRYGQLDDRLRSSGPQAPSTSTSRRAS
jgi:2-polyprenyl-3-methyl-5-hydroxy-6-metoxy-1,4-benzoquinol methylase